MTSIIKVDQIQNAAGGVPTAADLGLNVSGTVLNVGQYETNSTYDNTSSAWTTMWAPTYTPVKTSSIIIVNMKFNLRAYRNGGADGRAGYRVLVNGSEYCSAPYIGCYDYGGHGIWIAQTHSENLLLSNTTGATYTITLQTSTQNLCTAVNFNEASSKSSIVFTEIAG